MFVHVVWVALTCIELYSLMLSFGVKLLLDLSSLKHFFIQALAWFSLHPLSQTSYWALASLAVVGSETDRHPWERGSSRLGDRAPALATLGRTRPNLCDRDCPIELSSLGKCAAPVVGYCCPRYSDFIIDTALSRKETKWLPRVWGAAGPNRALYPQVADTIICLQPRKTLGSTVMNVLKRSIQCFGNPKIAWWACLAHNILE